MLANKRTQEEIDRTMHERSGNLLQFEDCQKRHYGGQYQMETELEWWNYVDDNLAQAVQNYMDPELKV